MLLPVVFLKPGFDEVAVKNALCTAFDEVADVKKMHGSADPYASIPKC